MNIELKILDFIQTLHIPILDKIMVWITSLGDAGMIWILLTAISDNAKNKTDRQHYAGSTACADDTV